MFSVKHAANQLTFTDKSEKRYPGILLCRSRINLARALPEPIVAYSSTGDTNPSVSRIYNPNVPSLNFVPNIDDASNMIFVSDSPMFFDFCTLYFLYKSSRINSR